MPGPQSSNPSRVATFWLPGRLGLALVFLVLAGVLVGHGLDSHAVSEHRNVPVPSVSAGVDEFRGSTTAAASRGAAALTPAVHAPLREAGGHGGATACLVLLSALALLLGRSGTLSEPALSLPRQRPGAGAMAGLPSAPPSLTALGVCRT